MARRKKHEEHENLERWLVSYADFITLMFAFFVVMYSLSSVNEGKYKVLSESLVRAFQNPTELIKRHPELAAGQKVPNPQVAVIRKPVPDAKKVEQEKKMKGIAKDVLKVLEPLVREGHVKVTQSERGIAIEINASILFSSGEARLAAPSISALTAVAQVLAEVENPIQVEGYTDNVPIKTPLYPSNWELSSARASSVVRLFIDNGVTPDRLVAVGYGENHPVDTNETPEGRASNRRVTVMILSSEQERVNDVPVVSGPGEGGAKVPAPAAAQPAAAPQTLSR